MSDAPVPATPTPAPAVPQIVAERDELLAHVEAHKQRVAELEAEVERFRAARGQDAESFEQMRQDHAAVTEQAHTEVDVWRAKCATEKEQRLAAEAARLKVEHEQTALRESVESLRNELADASAALDSERAARRVAEHECSEQHAAQLRKRLVKVKRALLDLVDGQLSKVPCDMKALEAGDGEV